MAFKNFNSLNFSNFEITNTAIKLMGKYKRKRNSNRKHNRKKIQDQNLLTIIIAVIVVVLLVIAFLTWEKKKHEQPNVKQAEPLPEDPRFVRLAELERLRDDKHLEKYLICKKLFELNAVEEWCNRKVAGAFLFLRVSLFIIVLGGLIITRIDAINFIGSTTTFLKFINAAGVVIFLAYFATSDENDSLMRCYHNSKPAAVRIFLKFIYWYYNIDRDNEEDLKNNRNSISQELKLIIDEIRVLERELNIDNEIKD